MTRQANKDDLSQIAVIDRLSFSGNKPVGAAELWVESHFNRLYEQYFYFVYEKDGKIVGYVGWELQGGFAREVPVIELQKLAVHPSYRHQGVGADLAKTSFLGVKHLIKEKQPEAQMMRVVVWTKKDNEKAQAIYRNICNEGIKGERDMYGTIEVMLRGSYDL